MDTPAMPRRHRPWLVQERTGFSSFKTISPIHFEQRWPRDVLIQATLDPDVVTLRPCPPAQDLPSNIVLAFESRSATRSTLVLLSQSPQSDIAIPPAYDTVSCLTRNSVLNGTNLLTSRMIWSKRSAIVPPLLAVRICSQARQPINLRELLDSAPGNDALVVDSVMALACNGYLDLFWQSILSDETIVQTRQIGGKN